MSDSPVTLTVTVDADALQAKLGEKAGPRLMQALVGGLRSALAIGAGAVQAEARAAGIIPRSGDLFRDIIGRLTGAESLMGEIGVLDLDKPTQRYAYLLGAEVKNIFPVRAKRLTIPIGDNLTPGGSVRFPTVSDLIAHFGKKNVYFARGAVFAKNPGKRAISRIYFLLKSGVTVRGRNVLGPAVRGAVPEMTQAVQSSVDALIGER